MSLGSEGTATLGATHAPEPTRLAGSLLARAGREGDSAMRYIVAWLLGVPLSVIALWYVVGHTACG